MDHIRVVEEVQPEQNLVESACDEVLLEDAILLPLLQRDQTCGQRRHNKHLMFAIRPLQLEEIFQLSDVFPARVVDIGAG